MNPSRYRVGIRRGGDPALMTLKLLSEIVTNDFRGQSVLIKPNLGFLGRPGTGIVTHCEVVRGVVRYMKEAGARPFIGDSCIFGVNPQEAFDRSGVTAVAREEKVDLINLDEGQPVPFPVTDPFAVDQFKVSSYAAEADRIVSVPVMKTHMHAVATLSLKNMKGCLHQREKMRLHHLREEDRFSSWHGYKNLDRAVADLSSVLYADLTVIDGVVAMEGLGPGLGEPKPLGLVLGGEDPIAADIAALYLMGFTPEELPHLHLAMKKKGRSALSFEELDVDREAFRTLRSPFKRAIPEDISSQYPEFTITSGETCSACDATITSFLKTWGKGFSGRKVPQIALGKKIDPAKILKNQCILLGNCTFKLKELGIFLEGCPPIGSDILKAINRIHSGGEES